MGIAHTLQGWKLGCSALMNGQSPVGHPEHSTYWVLTTYWVLHRDLGPELEWGWWTKVKESCPQDLSCLATLP